MILNKKDIEEYLNEGYTLIVNEHSWYISIKDYLYLGTVRFDTYLKINLNNFERVRNGYWIVEYKLKKGYSIWK